MSIPSYDLMFGTRLLNPMEIVKMDAAATVENKPIVIYHGNCADGFSAAWCFHNFAKHQAVGFPDFDFYAGIYNDAPPDITGRIVYLVDFSYKRDVVATMLEKAEHVYLIDHHGTALADLAALEAPNFTKYTDMNRSGAMLAWDFLHNCVSHADGNVEYKPGEPQYITPPLVLKYIQDRDLWKFLLPNSRQVNAAIFSYEYTFDNWDGLMDLDEDGITKLANQGDSIERKHFKDIKEIVLVTARMLPIGPYVVPVANMPYTFSSDAGYLMAEQHKDGTEFAACYWDTSTHRIFSLRSCTNGVDVSSIAATYGGGGHRNAAGFRVPRDHVLAIS